MKRKIIIIALIILVVFVVIALLSPAGQEGFRDGVSG